VLCTTFDPEFANSITMDRRSKILIYTEKDEHTLYASTGATSQPRLESSLTSKLASRRRAREEAGRNGGNGDASSSTERSLQIRSHGGSRVAGRSSLDGRSDGSIRSASPALQTEARTISTAAGIELARARLGPHGKVFDSDAGAWRSVGAGDFDGTARGAVGFCSGPVGECDVGELDTVTSYGGHGRPVLVNVERVGVAVTDEVLERDAADCTRTAVGLDHEHVVAGPGVDIAVYYVGNGSIGPKTAEGASTGPVAVDVFNQNVLGRRLDSHAFIFVGDHDIVDVDVGRPDINTIETAFIATTNGQVVDLV